MTKLNIVPEAHPVFNEFDRQGLLLGTPRLRQERNPAYRQRLMDVFVNRADSSYRGLINGITRELGLTVTDAIDIRPIIGNDGNPVLTQPAVIFDDTKCYLYSDFPNRVLIDTFDRFDVNGGVFTINELSQAINDTGVWVSSVSPKVDGTTRSMTIFNQSSVKEVTDEDISEQGGKIFLANNNLIEGTITVNSPNLTNRVSSETKLRRSGDYLIKPLEGVILSFGAPATGSFARYKYREDIFIAQSSPVIIHDLQSNDFKDNMFERACDSSGEECNGLPTELGAGIINELLSVFPTNWGR